MRCVAADSPLREGQSTLETVAIHMPRNSGVPAALPGGGPELRGPAAKAGPPVAAAITAAAPASSARRPMCAM
ncbi:hypothetical protein GCM10010215_45740 [Streptomyces virginiae]|nr:hypothetical protein GCM10010215_45740 [Streptomyces virginiae]